MRRDPLLASGAPALVSAGSATAIQGMRVLLVLDSIDPQHPLSVLLRRSECAEVAMTLGAEAVGRYEVENVDIVVMHLGETVVDEIEVTRRIRRCEAERSRARMPIVACGAAEHAPMFIEAGGDVHLAEPLSEVTLLETIRMFGADPVIEIDVDPVLGDLVPEFLEGKRVEIEAIRKVLAVRAYAPVERFGHNLKGSGGAYGLPHLSVLGARLECAALGKERAEADCILQEIRRYLGRLRIAGADAEPKPEPTHARRVTRWRGRRNTS